MIETLSFISSSPEDQEGHGSPRPEDPEGQEGQGGQDRGEARADQDQEDRDQDHEDQEDHLGGASHCDVQEESLHVLHVRPCPW